MIAERKDICSKLQKNPQSKQKQQAPTIETGRKTGEGRKTDIVFQINLDGFQVLTKEEDSSINVTWVSIEKINIKVFPFDCPG